MVKGSYLLVMVMERAEEVRVGRLGEIYFPEGLYLYCGSALGGVGPRVARHLRKEKKLHWHIDHLLTKAKPVGALVFFDERRLECRLAAHLASHDAILSPIKGFGCSDCSCASHLFHLIDESLLEALLKGLEQDIKL